MDLYSWIIESIKRHLLWRNSSVTHQTANETELNMKQDLKGNTSFKILFASILLSAGMYLPTSNKNITEDVLKGTKQWYQTIPRTVPEMVKSFGYPIEEHEVITQDGYILTLHRIPYGLQNNAASQETKRQPVILAHCLMGSSAVFAYGPTNNSLAYMLADEGYDVWLFNVRGNKYSKSHLFLDTNITSQQFWSYSFEENGTKDLPASIDYILNTTNFPSLHYIGFSMGTTQYFVFLSELPEYNRKILSAHLMAPVAFLEQDFYIPPILSSLATNVDWLGVYGLFGPYLQELTYGLCTVSEGVAQICNKYWGSALTSDEELNNPLIGLTQLYNEPAGTSLYTLQHFLQLVLNGGKFTRMDLGPVKNMRRYGTVNPPEYKLKNVQAPTKFYVGDSDVLTKPKNVEKLANLLPNHLGTEIVARKGWSHFDFAYSSNAGELVFKSMIEDLKNNATPSQTETPMDFETNSNLQCQHKNESLPINVIS